MTLFIQKDQRVGHGTVVDPEIRIREGKNERRGARLRCDCGNIYEVPLAKLVDAPGRKQTLSCGCSKQGGRPTKWQLNAEVGQRFGHGVVIELDIRLPVTPSQRKHGYVNGARGARLLCDCGNIYDAQLAKLFPRKDGRVNTSSCGCALKEHIRRVRGEGGSGGNRTHGLSTHPLYQTWAQMIRRCENPKNHNYPHYGGRGIKVCPEWHDVAVFIRDVEGLLGPRPAGASLDRLEADGDYELGNVKWSSDVEQARNKGKRVRSIRCSVCSFRMRLVYQSIAWWECPGCGSHNT